MPIVAACFGSVLFLIADSFRLLLSVLQKEQIAAARVIQAMWRNHREEVRRRNEAVKVGSLNSDLI